MLNYSYQDCADDTDNEVVAAAIQALGKCSHQIPESTQTCLNALISMIKSRYGTQMMIIYSLYDL